MDANRSPCRLAAVSVIRRTSKAKPDSAPDLILVRGVKGAKPELKSRPPFVIQNEAGERTEETRLLYEKGVIEYGRGKG